MYAFAAFPLALCLALSVLYPVKYSVCIKKACADYGVDESLVKAVILTESRYNKNATSAAGAQGLMQLMPHTAAWQAQKLNRPELAANLYEPQNNIILGTAYLKYLIDKFGLPDAIAAYNAGEGNLTKWKNAGLGDYAFSETRAYVKAVSRARKVYKIFSR